MNVAKSKSFLVPGSNNTSQATSSTTVHGQQRSFVTAQELFQNKKFAVQASSATTEELS
jgi:hypothetical protein